MSDFTIPYKGFTCTFMEGDERWRIAEQQDYSTIYPSLSAAKRFIDGMLKKSRHINDLDAFYLSGNYQPTVLPCTIFLLAAPEKGGYGDPDKGLETIRSAWVKRDGKPREKIRLGFLVPASAKAQLEEAERLDLAAKVARTAAELAWAAIPRLTVGDIMAAASTKESADE